MEQSNDSVETEAKLLEDAIAEGLARLGLTRAEAEIEILSEGKGGFLGIGSKNARVRVSRKSARSSRPGRNEPRSGRPREDRKPRERQAQPQAREPRAQRPPREKVVREPRPPREKVDRDLVADEAVIRDVLEHLIKALDEQASVGEIKHDEDGRYQCEINTENIALLLGRRGRTIDAIQMLAGAIASKKLVDRVKIFLDSGGFREKRKEALIEMARQAAKDAIEHNEEIHLEPMSAHDRKVIHAFLAEEEGVTSSSEDMGDRRHVVISPGSEKKRSDRSPRRGAGRGRSGGGGRSRSRGRRSRGPRSDDNAPNPEA